MLLKNVLGGRCIRKTPGQLKYYYQLTESWLLKSLSHHVCPIVLGEAIIHCPIRDEDQGRKQIGSLCCVFNFQLILVDGVKKITESFIVHSENKLKVYG